MRSCTTTESASSGAGPIACRVWSHASTARSHPSPVTSTQPPGRANRPVWCARTTRTCGCMHVRRIVRTRATAGGTETSLPMPFGAHSGAAVALLAATAAAGGGGGLRASWIASFACWTASSRASLLCGSGGMEFPPAKSPHQHARTHASSGFGTGRGRRADRLVRA